MYKLHIYVEAITLAHENVSFLKSTFKQRLP